MNNFQKNISIVKDNDPKKAVTTALEMIDGIDSIVKKFPQILIKPNLCGGIPGERGSHTSIEVLRCVLDIFSSYSIPLSIGEADCSFNDAGHMFRSLGIYELGKKYGAQIVNLSKGSFIDIAIPQASNLKHLRIATLLRESFILSVPVLKTHPWSGVTISMKNMYGAVYAREKAMYHNGLEKNIVDINRVIGAHLSIVDATVAVVYGGFKYGLWVGDPASALNTIIVGQNPVSVDAVGTRVLKRNPWDIGHIRIAAEQGLGTCDTENLNIISKGYTMEGLKFK